MINKIFFFDNARSLLFGGKLKQAQVDGMNAILAEWESKYSNKDDRWLAYMLATTYHETDTKMQPIEEYGRGKGRAYGRPHSETGQIYYGRGFVQLTWYANYLKAGKALGVDLVHNPKLALDLNIATQIMFQGMIKGWFTGKKLSDYFNETKGDVVNARRIINGTDKARLIADEALKFYSCISYTI